MKTANVVYANRERDVCQAENASGYWEYADTSQEGVAVQSWLSIYCHTTDRLHRYNDSIDLLYQRLQVKTYFA